MECVFRVSLESSSYALRNGFETGSEGPERQRRSRRILPCLEGSDRKKRRVGDSRRGTTEHSCTVLADFHTALLVGWVGGFGVMLRRLAQDFVGGFRESAWRQVARVLRLVGCRLVCRPHLWTAQGIEEH
ncbi:hypothetical protein NPIL_505651 [Nephila pilipes]|uniref:Uncharacterized protein n=1 Tax=Nephila pilipes TaxID=299642 RepID=A0A8X6N753_NEPPI|nr:hypothetical protein NPIL_505651 [Nephila pilipes]